MSFLLYLVYCVLLIRNQQFCERGNSGYVHVIRDEAKNITFRLQMHMENPCSCVGIVWGKLSKIC